MVAVKADRLLYFYGSHPSSLVQLTTTTQTSYWVQQVIKVLEASGRQRGESQESSRTMHWQCPKLALVPGSGDSQASTVTHFYGD